MKRPSRVGAFFDVDKTILAENSGTAYLKSLYERGEIDWKQVLFGLGTYLRYKLNLLDIERWVEKNGVLFRGRSEASLAQEAAELFRTVLLPSIYPRPTRACAGTSSRDTWWRSCPARPSSCSSRSRRTWA